MKVDGRCHCGAITFEGDVDPNAVSLCHCADCQMLSGTAYRAAIGTPAEAFVLRGRPKTYIKTAESGARRVHAFCPDCGTPIYSTSADKPTAYSLRVGTLTQRAKLKPKRQIWWRSALPWVADLRKLERLDKQ